MRKASPYLHASQPSKFNCTYLKKINGDNHVFTLDAKEQPYTLQMKDPDDKEYKAFFFFKLSLKEVNAKSMAPRIRTIGTYATQQKYSVDFFGDEFIVTVTPDPSVIGQWIHDVLYDHSFSQPLVVGVGVQWTPAGYHSVSSPGSYYSDSPPGSNNYDPPADTLQLCVGNRCIIIQLSYCDRLPKILHNFLADRDYTFVGVWNSQDARKLERSRHQLEIGELLDLRKFVTDSQGYRSLRACSFEKIVEACMGYRGVRLHKRISMSNWSVYDLSDDQILQASIDAYVCFKLGVRYRLWEY